MNNFYIPWKAWYGDEQLELTFPENWNVKSYQINDTPGLSPEQIKSRFHDPQGTEIIRKIAQGKKPVAIIVDDITRPTPLSEMLPEVITELYNGGIKRENIKIIIALGAHKKLNRDEFNKKLGQEVVSNFKIINHDPHANLLNTGIRIGKSPLLINKDFIESDFKIGISTVMPHQFAGFSGGAKLIFPGLADISSIYRSHWAALIGNDCRIGEIEENPFRKQAEKVVKKIGLDLSIDAVVNSKREIAGIFIGDVIIAHRRAIEFARSIYSTQVAVELDVAIMNAYPKDLDLIQSKAAFNVFRSTKKCFIKKNGLVIITSACSKGLGNHELFEPGGRLYREPVPLRFLGGRQLIFFSPNISKKGFHKIFWKHYQFFNNWGDVVSIVKSKFSDDCNIGVFPCATLQMVKG